LVAIACVAVIVGFAPLLTAQSGSRPAPAPASAAKKPSPGQTAQFQDWPKPSAVVAFSGQQRGYLEPCGCSPEFQKGGLARRAAFVKSLQEKKWPVVLADLGGMLDDHSREPDGKFMAGPQQAQAKLETALKAMHHMRYAVYNVGPEDIEVQDGFLGLMGLLANINNPPLPRTISANLGVDDAFEKAELSFPHRLIEIADVRIAFIGVVGAKYKDRMADPNLGGWQPPDAAIDASLRRLVRESAYQILMLYGDAEEAKRLATRFPDLEAIIYASDAEEPNSKPMMAGKTMLVTIGSKGKYTGVIGLFAKEPRLRFELVSLDDRFDEDPEIRRLLDVEYIDKLEELKLVSLAPKRDNQGLEYIGSEKCGECHEKVYEFWKSTRHSHALDTLVHGYEDKKTGKKIEGRKQHNPECASCHTTGFFYKTGYDGTEATLHLGGNGCENCHGPGSKHASMMSNPDIEADERREAKKMMHLGPQTEDRNVCIRCHDHENSPKFRLDDYWNQVDHGAEAIEDKENWPKVLEKLLEKKKGVGD
jgi:hypothetical protein